MPGRKQNPKYWKEKEENRQEKLNKEFEGKNKYGQPISEVIEENAEKLGRKNWKHK